MLSRGALGVLWCVCVGERMLVWEVWWCFVGTNECSIALAPCFVGLRLSVCGGSGHLVRGHVCGVEWGCTGCGLNATVYSRTNISRFSRTRRLYMLSWCMQVVEVVHAAREVYMGRFEKVTAQVHGSPHINVGCRIQYMPADCMQVIPVVTSLTE